MASGQPEIWGLAVILSGGGGGGREWRHKKISSVQPIILYLATGLFKQPGTEFLVLFTFEGLTCGDPSALLTASTNYCTPCLPIFYVWKFGLRLSKKTWLNFSFFFFLFLLFSFFFFSFFSSLAHALITKPKIYQHT